MSKRAQLLRDEFVGGLEADFPWLEVSDDWYLAVFWERVAAYYQCRAHCNRYGEFTRKGDVRPAALRGDKLLTKIEAQLDRMGGTPLSRAELRQRVLGGDDLAARASKMRNDDGG